MSYVALLKACDAGRAANKWLMVNVQNVQEFSCQVLNRDVWSNSTVKRVVHEHFVLWQVGKSLCGSATRLYICEHILELLCSSESCVIYHFNSCVQQRQKLLLTGQRAISS